MWSKTKLVALLLGLTSAAVDVVDSSPHSDRSDPYHKIEHKKGHYPWTKDFQPPEDSWDTTGRIVFLCIYAACWALVACIVYFREPLKRAAGKCCVRPQRAAQPGAEPLVPGDGEDANADHGMGSQPPYPVDKRIFDLFHEAAAKDPSATALILPDGDKWTDKITYGEMTDLFEELARALNSLGATKGSVVALVMQRSVAQLVGVWGTALSGAAFLPVDADAPDARKEVMIKDSGAVAVIRSAEDASTARLAERLSIPLVTLATDGQPNQLRVDGAEGRQAVQRVRPEADDMCLLIYTSGTTGAPKGIIYSHQFLVHCVYFYGTHCEANSNSVTLLKSPYFWGVFVWEMFPALTVGGKVVVASATGHKSPEYIANMIKSHSVDILFITPSVFDLVLDIQEAQSSAPPLKSVRHIATCGEPLPCALANRAMAMKGLNAPIHNFYAATETASTIYTVPRQGIDLRIFPNKAPAGRPQPHVNVHLLRKSDDGLVAVPLGEEGEICFAGMTATGYWKLDELTREKWVNVPGLGRVYRTGDVGRWTAGQLAISGRADRQVKVHGVRIEPEEVESCLKKFTVMRSDADGEKAQPALKAASVVPTDEPVELVAFAEVRDGVGEVTVDQLKAHCKANLAPLYNPKYFVILKEFPRLPNGKTNVSALKELAKEHAAETGEVVMDSLGQMKTLSRWAITERQVIHRCYAYWMFGVLVDHYSRCGMGKDAFGQTLGFCGPLASASVPVWIELMIRTIGNNQTMFGFIMLGAYQDSQPATRNAKSKVKFGTKDLFVLFVYLLMAVPITNFMDLIEDTRGKEYGWSYATFDWSQSNHRWYLLMTFSARLYMQIGEWLRVPGWIQSIVIALFLIIPNEAGDYCGASTPDSVNFLLTLIWRSNGRGSCPIFLRWFSIYTMSYVWCFHYLRPLVNLSTKRLPSSPTWAAVSLSAGLFLGVAAAMIHYPFTSVDEGTHMEWLPFELAIGLIQPTLFALAMTQFPLNMTWWGNTTLGCYVFHFYFRTRMTELILVLVPALAFDPTGILLFFAIVGVCVIIQTAIGPLGHYFLVGLQHVPSVVLKVLSKGIAKKPMKSQKKEILA